MPLALENPIIISTLAKICSPHHLLPVISHLIWQILSSQIQTEVFHVKWSEAGRKCCLYYTENAARVSQRVLKSSHSWPLFFQLGPEYASLPVGLRCKHPLSTCARPRCESFPAQYLLHKVALYLWEIAIFGDQPGLISDGAVEITQTYGLAVFHCINKHKQRDNSGQARNVTCEDGQHFKHVS